MPGDLPTRCRVCGEAGLTPLWEGWQRCLCCGSDTSPSEWQDVKQRYNSEYLVSHNSASFDEIEVSAQANYDLFERHRAKCPNKSFLDLGCAEGAILRGMEKRGWAVHGFDIIPEAKLVSPPGDHITVADRFAASLFPQQYAAILAREVLEHVPNWLEFLYECWHACARNGLFQVQTPRPTAERNPIGYQTAHLFLIAPASLRFWLERIGFDVLDYLLWDGGQCFICRKP